MATATAPATTPATHQTVKDILGEWPVDVVNHIETASMAMLWIEAILNVALKEERQGPYSDAMRMIEAARYLAGDFGNLADCQRESMNDQMRSACAAAEEVHP